MHVALALHGGAAGRVLRRAAESDGADVARLPVLLHVLPRRHRVDEQDAARSRPSGFEEELAYIADRVEDGDTGSWRISTGGCSRPTSRRRESTRRDCDRRTWLAAQRHVRHGEEPEGAHGRNGARCSATRCRSAPPSSPPIPRCCDIVKRSNLSLDAIVKMAQGAAGSTGTGSFTEIILGLPGDTREQAHQVSVRHARRGHRGRAARSSSSCCPAPRRTTPPAAQQLRGTDTGFRVLARGFGRYTVYGEEVAAAEIQEVCLGHAHDVPQRTTSSVARST